MRSHRPESGQCRLPNGPVGGLHPYAVGKGVGVASVKQIGSAVVDMPKERG